MAIMSLLSGWPRRVVEHGQNAIEHYRIKDRRNANHMPTRMNDLDRDSEGKRKVYRQEGRVVFLAIAMATIVTGGVSRTQTAAPTTAPTNLARLTDGF
jgi:hypothetical protein